MAQITLSDVPFARGATVTAHPRRSELKLPDMPPPGVAAVASATVSNGGPMGERTLVFDLDPGNYWAIGPNPANPPPAKVVPIPERPSSTGYPTGGKTVTLGGPPQLIYLSFLIGNE